MIWVERGERPTARGAASTTPFADFAAGAAEIAATAGAGGAGALLSCGL